MISSEKCHIFRRELQYMGNNIFIKGKTVCVKPLQSRLKAVSWIIFSKTELLNCWKTSFHKISIMASSGLRKMFI